MTRENPADVFDQATEQELMWADMSIAAIRSRGEEIAPNGTCHNCFEEIQHPKKFCNSDCGADYAKRNRK